MSRGFYENPRALLKNSCTKQSPITRKQYDCVVHFTSSLLLTNYSDIFADTRKQKEAVVLYQQMIEARMVYLKAKNNPPGANLDPSMGPRPCCSDTLFTPVYCINCISICIGK
jgi:hypothetical protein